MISRMRLRLAVDVAVRGGAAAGGDRGGAADGDDVADPDGAGEADDRLEVGAGADERAVSHTDLGNGR